mmetsp:Transcript_46730/g.149199  ORF Transcript_46730/g.149199 Transcript_46730/m.149199 type:complete len:204 (-) Transcript_46730:55-666(-)
MIAMTTTSLVNATLLRTALLLHALDEVLVSLAELAIVLRLLVEVASRLLGLVALGRLLPQLVLPPLLGKPRLLLRLRRLRLRLGSLQRLCLGRLLLLLLLLLRGNGVCKSDHGCRATWHPLLRRWLPQSRGKARCGSRLLLLLREERCKGRTARRRRKPRGMPHERRLAHLRSGVERGLVLKLRAHRVQRRVWHDIWGGFHGR